MLTISLPPALEERFTQLLRQVRRRSAGARLGRTTLLRLAFERGLDALEEEERRRPTRPSVRIDDPSTWNLVDDPWGERMLPPVPEPT